MGHDGQELGARGVERGQLGETRLDLGREAALLDDPCQQRGDRAQERDLVVVEPARAATLDVEHAHDVVVPDERHRQHPRESLDVEAADPREAVVTGDVLDRDRRPGLPPPGR